MHMKIAKERFFKIGSKLEIPFKKIEDFWNALEQQEKGQDTPFAKYLYYFGAMITISAMTWFMGLGWLAFGGLGIFFISAVYTLLFAFAGHRLWDKDQLRTPAGLLITMAVCMVPLAVYGLELHFNTFTEKTDYADFYSLVSSKWVWMEVSTLIAGIAALRLYPFPFLMAPVAAAAWFLSMDIVPLFLVDEASWETKSWISIIFGAVLVAIGLYFDKTKQAGHAFWCYLFGALSFWGGLGCLVWDKGALTMFVYALINVAMMCFAVILRRNVFMVFGALGFFAYLAYLADRFFRDSTAFPFILSLIGMLVIVLGILYQRNAAAIERNLRSLLPDKLSNFFDF